MAFASFEGYEFIQGKLKGDAWLQARPEFPGGDVRVYQRNPPDGTPTYPYYLIRWVVGIPLVAIGAIDVFTTATFDVMLVQRSNETGTMKLLANRMDDILNKSSGQTTDGEVIFCYKAPNMSEIASTDPWTPGGGTRVQNIGRPYRLEVKPPEA